MSDPLDLTGSWEGIFSYPRDLPPNGFRCDLRETAGRIVGETHERSDAGHDHGATTLALLDGTRHQNSVQFTKHYDDARRAHETVSYVGALSQDGDEITGRWAIVGDWSGTFIMVREIRHAAVEEQRRSETVD